MPGVGAYICDPPTIIEKHHMDANVHLNSESFYGSQMGKWSLTPLVE